MKRILNRPITFGQFVGAAAILFALAILIPIYTQIVSTPVVSAKRPTPIPEAATPIPATAIPEIKLPNGHKDIPDPCLTNPLGCQNGDNNGQGQPINGSLHASCKSQGETDPLCFPTVPTLVPEPTPNPDDPTPNSGGPSAPGTETSVDILPSCPVIKTVGYIGEKVVFNTTYSLISPAGEVWSFGDIRVDKVVFVASSPIFLEETGITAQMFTWIAADASRLEEHRFREDKVESTCKIDFHFVEDTNQ